VAQPSKPASSPITPTAKPASSPMAQPSKPAQGKPAPPGLSGLGMLAPRGGQGAAKPPAAPENKLAEKVKGRFGSRKPGSAPAELAPPSLKGLAKDLFSKGAPQRAFPEPEREEPEVEPVAHRPPPEIIPEGGVEGVDVAPIPILQQERPAKVSEQIARVMPKQFSKAELRRLEELYTLSDKKYPTLLKLGRNLSLEALQGRFDGLIGRGSEVSQLIDILNKRRSNNPLLVGPPGVGKTAIVEGLALALVGAQGEASGLGDRVLVELEMGRLLSGTQLRGSFAERLNAIKDEVLKAEGKIVIFLDELHTWIGAGASGDGGADAAGELKAALARGRFPCIGATTLDEYKKYIEGDPAFRRRFQVVEVSEPSDEVAIEILRGVLSAYEVHHKVRYDDEAVTAAVQLSRRYIPDQRLPDKAIGLLDLAGSRARRTERAAVDRVVVAEVVSEQTGVPLDKLLMKDRDRFLRMEEQLATSLIGHRGVIRRVCQVIRRNYAGFQSGRPIGSFLFLGPTGVGKTELVKVLADFLFRDRNAIVRLDMSEFREVHAVSRLIGAPPGYVGYDQGGQLTEAVRRRPYQIILLDEVEKAHPEVLNVLLQLLDDGRLTDGRGRTVDFSNTVVIMTSNLGSELFSESLQDVMRKARIGFARGDAREVAAAGDEAAPQVIAQARASLSPELWNRIEERLVFGPLSREEVTQIARLQFQDSARRLAAERDIYMEADDSLYPLLVDQGGYDPRLGARPMRQTLQRLVEAQVSEMILQGRVNAGDTLVIRAEDGALRFAVADR
jgi:ATP-dependent Clp protease ATP-binding subunit ClpC